MTLTCDPGVGYPDTLLCLRGALSFATAPTVRHAVLKALAERPDTLLVDVSDMTADDIVLTAFPALQRQAAAADVPLMLVGPSPALRAQLRSMAVTRTVPVFPTQDVALATRPAPVRVTRLLLPNPGAGVGAREVVDHACRQWQLDDDLADLGALIVTELAANAVRHAHTEFVVGVTLRSRYLHIGVRDFDPSPPLRVTPGDTGGRGLLIVEGVAAAWGWAPTVDGKVVWATLKLSRRG